MSRALAAASALAAIQYFGPSDASFIDPARANLACAPTTASTILSRSSTPTIFSLSTRFFGQPRLTSETDAMASLLLFFIAALGTPDYWSRFACKRGECERERTRSWRSGSEREKNWIEGTAEGGAKNSR